MKLNGFACCALFTLMLAWCQQPAPSDVKQVLGTIAGVDATAGRVLVKLDAGGQSSITVDSKCAIYRMINGNTDVSKAQKLQLQDLAVGDRIFVRGWFRGGELVAGQMLAMSESDVKAQAQAERQSWRQNGVEGVVVSTRPSDSELIIAQQTPEGVGQLKIKLGGSTRLLRYSDRSVHFADARPARLTDLHQGDQIRARGAIQAAGELIADTVIFGSFTTIFGKVVSADDGRHEIRLTAISDGKPISLVATPDTTIRRVPLQVLVYLIPRWMLPPHVQAQAPPLPAGRTGQDLVEELPRSRVSDLRTGEVVAALVSSSAGRESPPAIALLAGLDPLLTLPAVGSSKGGKTTTPLEALTLGLPREVNPQ